ncbi:MAG: hypothetical protein LBT20_03035 [Clostridiales bacterium]|jgi:hypothetical protein|nr:hypothetical protein [Clostridiales bacterium]
MWTTAISIGKEYEKEFDYMVGKFERSRDLTFATGTSRYRNFIEIAAEDRCGAAVTKKVIEVIADIVLIYFKASYIKSRLITAAQKPSDPMAVLISSLVYFDAGIENRLINRLIERQSEYAVDGIFLFRMRELLENWDELCALSTSLLSSEPAESDIVNLTSFLIDASDAKKNKIKISDGASPEIFNLSTGEKAYVHDIFSDEKQNLIGAVIGCYPEEIFVEKEGRIADTFKKIVKINRSIPNYGTF